MTSTIGPGPSCTNDATSSAARHTCDTGRRGREWPGSGGLWPSGSRMDLLLLTLACQLSNKQFGISVHVEDSLRYLECIITDELETHLGQLFCAVVGHDLPAVTDDITGLGLCGI